MTRRGAAGELSALLDASTSTVVAPAAHRKVEQEFVDPIPFELLILQQAGAA